MPSSPSTTTRLTFALRSARRPFIARQAQRIGQVSRVKMADSIATMNTSAEPSTANPAPGPM
jgi:hypothetical protein